VCDVGLNEVVHAKQKLLGLTSKALAGIAGMGVGLRGDSEKGTIQAGPVPVLRGLLGLLGLLGLKR
jgi:hypothetical protein